MRDLHRAITSLREELEAVDWYHQRATACSDPALQRILAHNRDEEIEHAAMLLEWIRRSMPGWDEHLRTYVYSSGDIVAIEADKGEEGESPRAGADARGLGIGKPGR